MLLLAADFYYLKNIAGRRLVGLRWWNEVNTATGDSHWVFESQDRSGADGGIVQNATDKRYTAHCYDQKGLSELTFQRFFWLALYLQPALWVGIAIFAIVRLQSPIWLFLIGEHYTPSFKSYTDLVSQSHRSCSDHNEYNGFFKM